MTYRREVFSKAGRVICRLGENCRPLRRAEKCHLIKVQCRACDHDASDGG